MLRICLRDMLTCPLSRGLLQGVPKLPVPQFRKLKTQIQNVTIYLINLGPGDGPFLLLTVRDAAAYNLQDKTLKGTALVLKRVGEQEVDSRFLASARPQIA